jgi:hypothetical protein
VHLFPVFAFGPFRLMCVAPVTLLKKKRKHIEQLPYHKAFNEKNSSTKTRPIQINQLLGNNTDPAEWAKASIH